MLKLHFRQSNKRWEFDKCNFVKEPNGDTYFTLESSQEASITLTVDYHLPVAEDYNAADFTCIPFTSPTLNKENNIFQVFERAPSLPKVRFAWIFPIQALLSNQHKEAENVHFLKYAFVTFTKLLRGEVFENIEIAYDDIANAGGRLTLDMFYPTDLIILSISNNATRKIGNFSIENYFQSFFQYDYYYCPAVSAIEKTGTYLNNPSITEINIESISALVNNNAFALELFKTHLRENNHPLAQFSLLYQIIELLIDKVYDFEIEKILFQAKDRDMPPHEIRRKVEVVSNMDTRVKKLFDIYVKNDLPSKIELINAIKALLFRIENVQDESLHVGELIYKIRNKIVHDFRVVIQQDRDYSLLNQINRHFSLLISETLNLFCRSKGAQSLFNEFDKTPLQWLQYKLLQEVDRNTISV